MANLAGIVRDAQAARGDFLALPKDPAGKILRREVRPPARDSA